MPTGYATIFPLKDAPLLQCEVVSYTRSHQGMYIRVSSEHQPQFYLYFAWVQYFSGPLHWIGAAFRLIENESERQQIFDAVGTFDLGDRYITDRLHIYVVELPSVTIIAGGVEKLDALDLS